MLDTRMHLDLMFDSPELPKIGIKSHTSKTYNLKYMKINKQFTSIEKFNDNGSL